MPTPNLIEQAANILQNKSATPKEKLAISGKLLWGAMLDSKDWTPELLVRARATYKHLTKCGNIKRTLDSMNEKDASRCLAQFTKEVTQLATDRKQTMSRRHR